METKFYIFQWKRQLDEGAPGWKKLFFRFIYRPFNQFCRFRLGLPTFNAEECCGCKRRLLWTEHQGICDHEVQAIWACNRETAQYGYHALPYNALEGEGTLIASMNHNYPLTDERTRKRYYKESTFKY